MKAETSLRCLDGVRPANFVPLLPELGQADRVLRF